MPTNPKGNIEKLERILNAWKSLAAAKSFGGMTLEQFEAFVTASKNARNQLAELENQIKETLNLRDSSDEAALAKAQLVKNGVLADPSEGENSALYEGMGYVRKDDKKSGLTRKKKPNESPT